MNEEFCCEQFKEDYEREYIEKDVDDNTEEYNGKYSTSCCCGSTEHGGTRIVRGMIYCPFCGVKLG